MTVTNESVYICNNCDEIHSEETSHCEICGSDSIRDVFKEDMGIHMGVETILHTEINELPLITYKPNAVFINEDNARIPVLHVHDWSGDVSAILMDGQLQFVSYNKLEITEHVESTGAKILFF